MTSDDLQVDGTNIELVAEGPAQGPGVLLLHPFPLHGGAWDGLRAALAAAGMRAASFDAPGFGGSPARGAPLEMDALARIAAAALDALALPRAALVGCSMGGYAALAFAELFPERLSAAVLLATRAGADSSEARARREAQAQAVLARGPQEVMGPMATSLLAPGAEQRDPGVAARVRALAAGASAQGIADALRGMALRPDRAPGLARFPAPALVIAGELDQLIPRAELEALARGIPGARLEVVAGTGHLPFLEDPSRVAALTTEFLTSSVAF